MAVEDHPKYDEWSKALDHLKDANDHYRDVAKGKANTAINAAKRDLHNAQAAYDKISSEIE